MAARMTERSAYRGPSRPTSVTLRQVRSRILRDLIAQHELPLTVAGVYSLVAPAGWTRETTRVALCDLVATGVVRVVDDTARSIRLCDADAGRAA